MRSACKTQGETCIPFQEPSTWASAHATTVGMPGARHSVYVILLHDPRRRQSWGLYVGQTSRDPDWRFDQHKAGYKASGSWGAHRSCQSGACLAYEPGVAGDGVEHVRRTQERLPLGFTSK